MKVLYFDCFSGISGDMTIGALLELCDKKEEFLAEMNKLSIEGYQLAIGKTEKNGIGATKFDVLLDAEGHEHHHGHSHKHNHTHEHEYHQHIHRNLMDVEKIIEDSAINESAKTLAKRIFRRVAEAEAKVHQKTLEEVHFHEVGAIDSLVDIIGTAILIDLIQPDQIVASVVQDGHGFIRCQHGVIPVPVPATAEIFAASHVISKQIDVETELVTPTGAAIIAELAESFGPMPQMSIQKVGYGAGMKNLAVPNVLRVVLGESN